MPYPTEQDPLLPIDKPAPEIQGSRPQSIKDVGDVETQPQDNHVRPPRSLLDNLMTMMIGLCAVAVIIVIFMPEWFLGDIGGDWRPPPRTLEERVARILTDTPLIDGHNDLAVLVRGAYNNHIYDEKFKIPFEEGGMPSHVDIPRLKEGKSGGAFWSVFAPCPKNGTDFTDANYAASVAFTLGQIDLLARLQSVYPAIFSPPPSSSAALAHFKSGKLISPLGIEGLHQIGNSVSNLRHYYNRGVRYATLTHNCHNVYADAAIVGIQNGIKKSTPLWGGVSTRGRDLVREMNRMGMIVDLSHTSPDTMRDILGAGNEDWEGSAAPVIFSHSSAYAVCPHPRNVPDDVLHLVKKRNSVVMVNFEPSFVSCIANPDAENGIPDLYPPNATLQHVVTHIKHIGELIGYEHVGLGSDFDGIDSTPKGLDDVSKFPELVAEMLRQGVTDEEAGLVVGGNVLRVWRDVDKVSAEMQKKGTKPLEDELPSLMMPRTLA